MPQLLHPDILCRVDMREESIWFLEQRAHSYECGNAKYQSRAWIRRCNPSMQLIVSLGCLVLTCYSDHYTCIGTWHTTLEFFVFWLIMPTTKPIWNSTMWRSFKFTSLSMVQHVMAYIFALVVQELINVWRDASNRTFGLLGDRITCIGHKVGWSLGPNQLMALFLFDIKHLCHPLYVCPTTMECQCRA